jgi:hypothetical protein
MIGQTTDERPLLQVLGVQKHRKGVLRGFCDVRLPNGFTFKDCVVCESNGKRWATLPSKPMVGADGTALRTAEGKLRYSPVIDAPKDLQRTFSDRVVKLIGDQWPDVFDGDGLP